MISFLNVPILNFKGHVGSSPAVEIFGLGITYYALLIVTGMVLAIVIFSYLLKKQGLNPDDSLDYAIVTLPLAVLGTRLYFFLFPYEGQLSDWSTFWDFRDGGLGIYGGVIVGYLVIYAVSRYKMQNFGRVADCIVPGLFLAQCIGRWGNFINGEAYGNLVTNPSLQWFPYAVKIGSEYYQATFFYESMCTLIGFIVTLLLITKYKRFKRGFNLAFYGVFYGVVRLIIESLRTDSLYLWIRWNGAAYNTGIKISQFVSVVAIVLGAIRFILIYTKWNRPFEGFLYRKTNYAARALAKVERAQKRADRLSADAKSIYEQLEKPLQENIYKTAKRKADYAVEYAKDVRQRYDEFLQDMAKQGINVDNPPKTKATKVDGENIQQ